MSLLDQLAGKMLGGLGTQKQDSVSQPDLLASVMTLINDAGGLPALLQKFQEGGLGDQLASWIGTGENQAVSGNQINDALGKEAIGKVAQQTGMEPEHVSAGLAQLLPQVVDKLTPNGQVPDNDMLKQGLALLQGRLFG